MIKDHNSETMHLLKESSELFTLDEGYHFIPEIDKYDIILNLKQLKTMNIHNEAFFANVYNELIMEKSCGVPLEYTVQNRTDSNKEYNLLHNKHASETVGLINELIEELHMAQTNKDYESLIDKQTIAIREMRQSNEIRDLTKRTSYEPITKPIMSLLYVAIYEIINDDSVVESCDGYQLQRNRIQAIKILLNLKKLILSGQIINNDLKNVLLWKVELCRGWKL